MLIRLFHQRDYYDHATTKILGLEKRVVVFFVAEVSASWSHASKHNCFRN